jgi:hypothetical protein
MKNAIILSGKPFDWDEGAKMQDLVADAAAEGHVNWYAAAGADPGVMKCPGCGEYLWKEGERVRCPDCGHEWTV